MDIAIVGSGYVGLVTGVCLAHIGHRVICVDNDREKIRRLKAGRVPIYEPGLEDLMRELTRKGRLTFSTSVGQATKASQVVFIAVGTPSKPNGEADLTYVENVAREIALNMDSYRLIVEKSTVPAATGSRIRRTVELNLPKRLRKNGVPFDVASNPEFLREGCAVADFLKPDRVVIGVGSKRAEKILREIYRPVKTRLVVTDINSAEMIKHASNAFLAMKISFANALSRVCEAVDADVLKVVEGMGLDRRIGRAFLDAGIGYGGSCFPKDVDAFIRLSEKHGYPFRLLREVREVNARQQEHFVRLIEDKLWNIKGKTVGVWGLAFKPDTDDMRNAPSVVIVERLQKEGARIRAYDPQAMGNARRIFKKVTFCKDAYAAARGSDCLLLLTEWDVFREVDLKKVLRAVRRPLIFDGRNLYAERDLEGMGFEYYGIGRGGV